MDLPRTEAHQIDLQERIAVNCGHRNVADAQLTALVAEAVETGAWFMGGIKSPEHFVAWQTGSSLSRAHHLVAIAARRTELPAAYAAFQNGELSFDQIASITAHVPAWADGEVTELARYATVTQLRQIVRKYPWPDDEHDDHEPKDRAAPDPVPPKPAPDDWDEGPEPTWDTIDTGPGWNDPFDDDLDDEADDHEPTTDAEADDVEMGGTLLDDADPSSDADNTDAGHATADEDAGSGAPAPALPPQPVFGVRARAPQDFLSLTFDEHGRFRLVVEGDAVDGALLEQAIKEAHDRLFREKQPDLTWVDALTDVAARSLASIPDHIRADRYRTYLHIDTEHTWLSGGPNLPDALTDLVSCDGTVKPIWTTHGRPVNIGRTQQIVPNHTRRIIYDRDRTCRHPGCSGARHLQIHHIVHWRNGGPTDTWNLIALCPFHHRAHHKGHFSVEGNADEPDGITFTVDGKPLARPAPKPPDGAPPPAPAPGYAYQHPTGEQLDMWCVAFTPPRQAA